MFFIAIDEQSSAKVPALSASKALAIGVLKETSLHLSRNMGHPEFFSR
jgi:hypothetical protein